MQHSKDILRSIYATMVFFMKRAPVLTSSGNCKHCEWTEIDQGQYLITYCPRHLAQSVRQPRPMEGQ